MWPRSCTNFLGVDSLEKYCESCLTRVDIEQSQRASTQALSKFRQSMMDDMNILWQSVIMHPPPPQPATLSPLPSTTTFSHLSSSSGIVC